MRCPTGAVSAMAMMVVAWMLGLFLKLGRLESRNQRVRQEVRQVFLETLPEAAGTTDELIQLAEMEQRVAALRSEHDAFASVASAASFLA